ncbi:cytochrome P450 [Phanerochaete sordida]|uniref:Cytochrome P450 n=1 Tax=Phanerochaete sordida TaxID=48140 RepID=A0A9P3FXC9_9APHY|nr:cytochrome P450 [Phanerochaete sordida]
MTTGTVCGLLAFTGWILWKLCQKYLDIAPLDNVPGLQRTSLWQGNVGELWDRHGSYFHHVITQRHGPVFTFHTLLRGRGLYISDPKALHHILVKDATTFEESPWFLDMNRLSFGPGLFATIGEQHKKQRRILQSAFSANHMRAITPTFYSVAHRLRASLSEQLLKTGCETEVLEWLGRTALEAIGTAGLGCSLDDLTPGAKNPYRDALKDLVPTIFALHFWRSLLPYTVQYVPLAIRQLGTPWLPHPDMQKLRNVVGIMDERARNIYHAKKYILHPAEEVDRCRDEPVSDVLRRACGTGQLSEEETVALISTATFAATDTTSNAMARILQLLSEHQNVQDKMRAELLAAGPDGSDIPYNRLIELTYLDAVCRETLRLYPPVPFMTRESRHDAVVPLSEPIHGVDGSLMNEVVVPKGTTIIIGIRACNTSKKIWGEDCMEWKPERWLSPLPASVVEARVPGAIPHLMTFLGGGRACIGFKFAQLEMKVLLSTLLRAFKIMPGSKDVYWNLATVNYPTVGKDSGEPGLYLKLEPLAAA